MEKGVWEDVIVDDLKKCIKDFGSWKCPGVDHIHNYWWERFTNLHECTLKIVKGVIRNPDKSPQWLTTGRTRLAIKKIPTNEPRNYRPITCLPVIYKITSSIITGRMKSHLEANKLIPEEQKGGISNCNGCVDQLLINSMVLDDAKKHQKDLSIAWIDYQKAFDSVPHDWIIQSLKMHKFDDVTINFFKETMNKWKTNLIFGCKDEERTTDIIHIKNGIFQGDCPSCLIFILCLLPLTWL